MVSKKHISRVLGVLLLIQAPHLVYNNCTEYSIGNEYLSLCQCQATSLQLVCYNVQFGDQWFIKYEACDLDLFGSNVCNYKYPKSVVIEQWLLQKHLDADSLAYLPTDYKFLVLTLSITSSNISGIDSGSFASYTNLETLVLNNNEIETLERGVFSKQSALDYLDLSNNKLQSIHDGLFLEDKKIKTLKLNNNKISYLDGDSFYNLPKVAKIYLGNNKISSISLLLFRRQTALSYLDLSHNFIEMVEETVFSDVTNLEEIYLQSNRIVSIPKGLFQTQENLRIVDLSNNPIVTYFPLNQIIGHSISLEKLNFNNISQSQLILENLNASRVKVFSANNNNIIKIPSKAFELTSFLEFIDLSFNYINYVDNNAFGRLFKLLTLKLNNNDIETLFSGTFMFLRALTELDLSYNKISFLPLGLLDSCSNLATLRVSHNRLKYLNKFNFVSLKNLKTLQIDNNALTQLDGVSSLPQLQEISLQNNSWKCEELFNLIEKLESKSVTISVTSSEPPIGHHIKQISCDHKDVYFDINEEKPEENLYEESLKNMSLRFDKLAKNMDKFINESQRKYLNQNQRISDHFINISSEIFIYLHNAQDNASLSNQRLEATFARLFQNATLSNIESREDFKSGLLTIEKYFETITSSLESISSTNSGNNQEYLKKMNEIVDTLKDTVGKIKNEKTETNNETFSYIFLCIGLCLLIIVGVGVFRNFFKQRNRYEDNQNCMIRNILDDSLL